jgi:alpha-tubulin suppressor-like RCC1 family protein
MNRLNKPQRISQFVILFIVASIAILAVATILTTSFSHAASAPFIDAVVADNGSQAPAVVSQVNGSQINIYGSGFAGDSTAAADDVALSDGFGCAISSGKVYCWGSNNAGQLGLGDYDSTTAPMPVKIGKGSAIPENAIAQNIFAKGNSVCALFLESDTTHDVYCWGDNSSSQLGNSNMSNSSLPVKWNPNTGDDGIDAKKLVMGPQNVCIYFDSAENPDDGWYCTGKTGTVLPTSMNTSSANDLIGHPTLVTTSDWAELDILPTTIPNPDLEKGFILLSNTACNIVHQNSDTSATIQCWGSAKSGLLGTNSGEVFSGTNPTKEEFSAVHKAHRVTAVSGVSVLSIGYGSSNFTTPVSEPKLSAAEDHICLYGDLRGSVGEYNDPPNFQIACWGNDNAAQLGVSRTITTTVESGSAFMSAKKPVFTDFGTPSTGLVSTNDLIIKDVSTSPMSTCALVNGNFTVGGVKDEFLCWGANNFGQAGRPISTTVNVKWGADQYNTNSGSTAANPLILYPMIVNSSTGASQWNSDGYSTSTGDKLGIYSGENFTCLNIFDSSNPLQGLTCFGLDGSGQLGSDITASQISPATFNTVKEYDCTDTSCGFQTATPSTTKTTYFPKVITPNFAQKPTVKIDPASINLECIVGNYNDSEISCFVPSGLTPGTYSLKVETNVGNDSVAGAVQSQGSLGTTKVIFGTNCGGSNTVYNLDVNETVNTQATFCTSSQGVTNAKSFDVVDNANHLVGDYLTDEDGQTWIVGGTASGTGAGYTYSGLPYGFMLNVSTGEIKGTAEDIFDYNPDYRELLNNLKSDGLPGVFNYKIRAHSYFSSSATGSMTTTVGIPYDIENTYKVGAGPGATFNLPDASVGSEYSQKFDATGYGTPRFVIAAPGASSIPADYASSQNSAVNECEFIHPVQLYASYDGEAENEEESAAWDLNPANPAPETARAERAACIAAALGNLNLMQGSIIQGDPLPPGMSFNTLTGELSGTPTTFAIGPANYNFQIGLIMAICPTEEQAAAIFDPTNPLQADDYANAVSCAGGEYTDSAANFNRVPIRTYDVNFKINLNPVVIDPELPAANVGVPFERTVTLGSTVEQRPYRLASTNPMLRPITWSVHPSDTGLLPPGFALDSEGKLVSSLNSANNPIATEPGVYKFRVIATDSTALASDPFEVTIDVEGLPSTAQNISIHPAKRGKPYSVNLLEIINNTVNAYPKIDTISIVAGSNCSVVPDDVPAGLTFNDNEITGNLGWLVNNVNYEFCVKAENETGFIYVKTLIPVDNTLEIVGFDAPDVQSNATSYTFDVFYYGQVGGSGTGSILNPVNFTSSDSSASDIVGTIPNPSKYTMTINGLAITPGQNSINFDAKIVPGGSGVITTPDQTNISVNVVSNITFDSDTDLYGRIRSPFTQTINMTNAVNAYLSRTSDCGVFPFPTWATTSFIGGNLEITGTPLYKDTYCALLTASNSTAQTQTTLVKIHVVPLPTISQIEKPIVLGDGIPFEAFFEAENDGMQVNPYQITAISNDYMVMLTGTDTVKDTPTGAKDVSYFTCTFGTACGSSTLPAGVGHLLNGATIAKTQTAGMQIKLEGFENPTTAQVPALEKVASISFNVTLQDGNGATSEQTIMINVVTDPIEVIYQGNPSDLSQTLGDTASTAYQLTAGESLDDFIGQATGPKVGVYVSSVASVGEVIVTQGSQADQSSHGVTCAASGIPSWLEVHPDGSMHGKPDAAYDDCVILKFATDYQELYAPVYFHVSAKPTLANQYAPTLTMPDVTAINRTQYISLEALGPASGTYTWTLDGQDCSAADCRFPEVPYSDEALGYGQFITSTSISGAQITPLIPGDPFADPPVSDTPATGYEPDFTGNGAGNGAVVYCSSTGNSGTNSGDYPQWYPDYSASSHFDANCKHAVLAFDPLISGDFTVNITITNSEGTSIIPIYIHVVDLPHLDPDCSLVAASEYQAALDAEIAFECDGTKKREFASTLEEYPLSSQIMFSGSSPLQPRISDCEYYNDDTYTWVPVAGDYINPYDPDFSLNNPTLNIEEYETGCLGIGMAIDSGDLKHEISSGTPAGTYRIWVTLSNFIGEDVMPFYVTVVTPPILNLTSLPTGFAAKLYGQEIDADGGSKPMHFAAQNKTELPARMFICGNGENGGLPEGHTYGTNSFIDCGPQDSGAINLYTSKLRAAGAFQDNCTINSVSGNYDSLPCYDEVTSNVLLPTCESLELSSLTTDSICQEPTVSGHIFLPCSLGLSPNIPAGTATEGLKDSAVDVENLKCDKYYLYGLPADQGAYNFTMSAENILGLVYAPFDIAIVERPIIRTPGNLPTVKVNKNYNIVYDAEDNETGGPFEFATNMADSSVYDWVVPSSDAAGKAEAEADFNRITSGQLAAGQTYADYADCQDPELGHFGLPDGIVFSDLAESSPAVVSGRQTFGPGLKLSGQSATQGYYCFAAKIENVAGSDERLFLIIVNGIPRINITSLPIAREGIPYMRGDFNLTGQIVDREQEDYNQGYYDDCFEGTLLTTDVDIPGTGNCGPVTMRYTAMNNTNWIWANFGDNIPGVVLNSSGILTGTPTKPGIYHLVITGTSAGGSLLYEALLTVEGKPRTQERIDTGQAECSLDETDIPEYEFPLCIVSNPANTSYTAIVGTPIPDNEYRISAWAVPGTAADGFSDDFTWSVLPAGTPATADEMATGTVPVQNHPDYTGLPSGLTASVVSDPIGNNEYRVTGTPDPGTTGDYKWAVIATNNATGPGFGDSTPVMFTMHIDDVPHLQETSDINLVSGVSSSLNLYITFTSLQPVTGFAYCTPTQEEDDNDPDYASKTWAASDGDLPPYLRVRSILKQGSETAIDRLNITGVVGAGLQGIYYFAVRVTNATGNSDCRPFKIIMNSAPIFTKPTTLPDTLTDELFTADLSATSLTEVEYIKANHNTVQAAYMGQQSDYWHPSCDNDASLVYQSNAKQACEDGGGAWDDDSIGLSTYQNRVSKGLTIQKQVTSKISTSGHSCISSNWATIDSNGVVSGVPDDRNTPGISSCIVVIAENDYGYSFDIYYLDIYAAPAIEKSNIHDWAQNVPNYSAYVLAREKAASHKVPEETISYSHSGSWPTGLSLNPVTGEITGTPTATGTYTFTIRAENVRGYDEKAYIIEIGIKPVLDELVLDSAEIGAHYTQDLTGHITSDPTANCLDVGKCTIELVLGPGQSEEDVLPEGITYDSTTGELRGDPQMGDHLPAEFPLSYPLTFRITDTVNSQSSDYNFDLSVGLSAPKVYTADENHLLSSTTSNTLNEGGLGINYRNYENTSAGETVGLFARGAAPVEWKIVGGDLPFGLTATQDPTDTRYFYIEGVPTTVGAYSFEAQATNVVGSTKVSIIINVLGYPLIADESARQTSHLGQVYDYTLITAGVTPIKYDIVASDAESAPSIARTATADDLCLTGDDYTYYVPDENIKVIDTGLATSNSSDDVIPKCFALNISTGQVTGSTSQYLPDAAQWLTGGYDETLNPLTTGSHYPFHVRATNRIGSSIKDMHYDITGMPLIPLNQLDIGVVGEDYQAELLGYGLNPLKWEIDPAATILSIGLGYECNEGRLYGVLTQEGLFDIQVIARNDDNPCVDIQPVIASSASLETSSVDVPSASDSDEGLESRTYHTSPNPTTANPQALSPQDYEWDCAAGNVCTAQALMQLQVFTKPSTAVPALTATQGLSFSYHFFSTGSPTIHYFPQPLRDYAGNPYYKCINGQTPKECRFTNTSVIYGKLPNGMWFNSEGVLAGIPTEPGDYSFTLIAQNPGGETPFEVKIHVNPNPAFTGLVGQPDFTDGGTLSEDQRPLMDPQQNEGVDIPSNTWLEDILSRLRGENVLASLTDDMIRNLWPRNFDHDDWGLSISAVIFWTFFILLLLLTIARLLFLKILAPKMKKSYEEKEAKGELPEPDEKGKVKGITPTRLLLIRFISAVALGVFALVDCITVPWFFFAIVFGVAALVFAYFAYMDLMSWLHVKNGETLLTQEFDDADTSVTIPVVPTPARHPEIGIADAQDLSAQDLTPARHPEIGIADAQDLSAQDLTAQDLTAQDLTAQDLTAQDLDQAPFTTQAPDFDNAYVTHIEPVAPEPVVAPAPAWTPAFDLSDVTVTVPEPQAVVSTPATSSATFGATSSAAQAKVDADLNSFSSEIDDIFSKILSDIGKTGQ